MNIELFNYNLPKNLIAQKPLAKRDHSKLMVLDRKKETITHDRFFNILDYLNKDDVLVLNNSKVFPAHLNATKQTGGKVSLNLTKKINKNTWAALTKPGIRINQTIYFHKDLSAKVIDINQETYERTLEFSTKDPELDRILLKIGQMPTPPYVKDTPKKNSTYYQNYFADDEKTGSVAAPTAGFHFTPQLLQKIKDKGIQIEYITLHVGFGTFKPIEVQDIVHHDMHSELVQIDQKTLQRLVQAKQNRNRIVSVGSTSTRTLESILPQYINTKDLSKLPEIKEEVTAYFYPGYKFKIVDALITNFHLPKSTLLVLVSAFANRKFVLRSYKKAIKNNYRFYSFGDSMLIK